LWASWVQWSNSDIRNHHFRLRIWILKQASESEIRNHSNEKINESLELDFVKLTSDNPLKNYDCETIEHIDLELPKIEVDGFNNVIFDE
jgi:hypothetical protein